MKNILFIVSHLGSGSHILFNSLNRNPRVQGFRIDKPYSNPLALEHLTSHPHKLDNTAAIYMEELLFNYSFSCPQAYDYCKFIYLIRDARPTLNNIVTLGYDPICADLYYRYRLRRICEMAKRTPQAILLTWDDVLSGKKFSLIEKYLNLKDPISLIGQEPKIKEVVDLNIINKSQRSYERYFYFLKKFINP